MLKGQCHAVLVKHQNTSSHQSKPKNNAVVLFPMTIEVHRSYSRLFAAKDGENGNRLKLQKTGQIFFKFLDSVLGKTQKLNTNK